jgi:hypothetical protein
MMFDQDSENLSSGFWRFDWGGPKNYDHHLFVDLTGTVSVLSWRRDRHQWAEMTL